MLRYDLKRFLRAYTLKTTLSRSQLSRGDNLLPGLDLRSDTLTLPSKEMMNAMQQALCGDDVYGEDYAIKVGGYHSFISYRSQFLG